MILSFLNYKMGTSPTILRITHLCFLVTDFAFTCAQFILPSSFRLIILKCELGHVTHAL